MDRLIVFTGPEKYRSFDLKEGVNYIGRSSESGIIVPDLTVSRRHLKVIKQGAQYWITDLHSMNGTFYDGEYIVPGVEVKMASGTPIVIGMSVLCIGGACMDQVMALFESIGLSGASEEKSDITVDYRCKTNQRNLELVYNVADVLTRDMPIKETLEGILDHIFNLLTRLDRAAFILIDPATEEIIEVASTTRGASKDGPSLYWWHTVQGVLKQREPVAIANAETVKDDALKNTLKIMNVESVMCVPLKAPSLLMGALYVDSQEIPYGFRKEDVPLFMSLGRRIALSMEEAHFRSAIGG